MRKWTQNLSKGSKQGHQYRLPRKFFGSLKANSNWVHLHTYFFSVWITPYMWICFWNTNFLIIKKWIGFCGNSQPAKNLFKPRSYIGTQYEKCLDMIYTVSTCSWCFLSDNFSAFVDFVSHNTRFLMTIVLFSALIYVIMSPVGKCTSKSNANSYLIW